MRCRCCGHIIVLRCFCATHVRMFGAVQDQVLWLSSNAGVDRRDRFKVIGFLFFSCAFQRPELSSQTAVGFYSSDFRFSSPLPAVALTRGKPTSKMRELSLPAPQRREERMDGWIVVFWVLPTSKRLIDVSTISQPASHTASGLHVRGKRSAELRICVAYSIVRRKIIIPPILRRNCARS